MWCARPGVKKLGGKKLGGAKIAKAAASTDWDNANAALPSEPEPAVEAEEITSEADGLDKLTCKPSEHCVALD